MRVALVLLSGCASGPEPREAGRRRQCEFVPMCLWEWRFEHQLRQRRARQEDARRAALSTRGGERSLRVVLAQVDTRTGGEALGEHLAFIRQRQEALSRPGVAQEERRLGQRVLWEMLAWLHSRGEAELARESPEEVYARLKALRLQAEREDAARVAAVERKLAEYERWAEARFRALGERFTVVGREYLLTENDSRHKAQGALIGAVLTWAYTHTDDPDFLKKSPSQVALYLLARRSALSTALQLAERLPPHLDYTPQPDEDEATPEQLAVEVLAGLTPGLGEVADAQALLSGWSLTGRRLSGNERLLAAVGVLLPVVSGKLLTEVGETAAQRAALLTGRSLEEGRVLLRVAHHLSPQDTQQIDRILRAAAREGNISEADLQFLRGLARRLDAPLTEAAEALRRGAKVPFLGVRADASGARLLPGSAEHVAQCWVDYQFRHPGKYARFTYAVDPEWQRLYRSILENKGAGTAFEREVLQARGYPKNTAMMMPPPGAKAQGFIPDSVQGNPEELVWGKAYHFAEVKGRADMALTGNLKAMLDYVRDHGGHVELWIRSARHPDGQTRLTQPLQDRLAQLGSIGRATVRRSP